MTGNMTLPLIHGRLVKNVHKNVNRADMLQVRTYLWHLWLGERDKTILNFEENTL